MSRRPPLPDFIPTAVPVAEPVQVSVGIPTAVPVGADGLSLIPDLRGRAPTRAESELMSGQPIACGSTNVKEFYWKWDYGGQGYNPALYVTFLDDSWYVYYGVPLSVAVAFVQTDSHGRFVWNHLRDKYQYKRLRAGSGTRARPQVVRLHNK